MKNRALLFLIIFSLVINLFLVNLISSQEALKEVPGISVTEKFTGGEIDPNTGLPKKFSEFREKADELKNQEQNNSYLRKEWTKILANNKVFGPLLFYTDKFFSFFNPLWRFSFGIEFSWSLIFFFHVFLWGILVALVAIPIYNSKFLNLPFSIITGIITASITGSLGLIKIFANILETAFVNLLAFTAIVIIIIILIVLYGKLLKGFREETEKEKLERAKKNIKAYGEASEEFLK